ncbi:MAG: phospholipid carrier-dependent glycosyltransferase [Chloroflexota bacterium]
MKEKVSRVLTRNEFLAPLALFLLFFAVSVPGISWGAPALWNPDELVWRVDKALHDELVFDVSEPDANYPSLPKHVMYIIGSISYGIGHSTYAFIVSARLFSVALGALVAALVYYLARTIGANRRTAALAGLIYVVSGVVSANARFAHNDLYLQLFTVLCLYFVIRYQYTRSRIWLYVSYLSVGMAASSKYTGVSMLLLPLGVFFLMSWGDARRDWFRSLGSLLIGAVLVVLGYAIGTPRLLLSPVDYLMRTIPAALRFSRYGFYSETPIGLYGQWAVFEDAVGGFVFYFFLAGFVWSVLRVILHRLGKMQMDERRAAGITILLSNVVLFDLPFLISINYVPRHFIPFVPILSILGALSFEEVVRAAGTRRWPLVRPASFAVLWIGILFSFLRLASIALLFMNDARIPASEFIDGIRGYGKSIEYTLYPPVIDKKRFERAHNYPIYFVKYPNEELPIGGRHGYNLGEQGLLARDTDYFVIDSYTYERFYIESTCASNPVECDFFKRLLAGEVNSYRLTHDFSYRLPPWLPQVVIAPVNPDIKFYERVRE